jgi:hypothetical protein
LRLPAPAPEDTDVTNSNQTLRDDILWGAQAIADAIGRDVRDVYYLLQRGLIPATKTGDIWTTTRSRLRRHFEGEAA